MLRSLLATIALLATMLPAWPAQAATVYEIHHIPTIGGATLRVETVRDPANDPQPVILTYSPYNNLGDGGSGLANDNLAGRFVPEGYARAYADVLGTRGSTGCWDYGGNNEIQSGIDLVNFLSNEVAWSNGNVAMIGVSYEGTTANMVASRGDEVPGLKAIVPVAAISRWYGYAYSNGVRYFMNSENPSDEGFDTPAAFDFGFGRTVPPDPNDDPENFGSAVAARVAECDSIEHTQQAYNPNPDYSDFWLERDYIAGSNYRASALIVHGWQDYNVKQGEAINLYEAMPVDDPATVEVEGVPDKYLWLTQSPHADGSGQGYADLLAAFFAQTLKGDDDLMRDWRREHDVDGAIVRTAGRDINGEADTRFEAAWPPESTSDVTLHLGRWFDYDLGSPVESDIVGSSGETGVLSLAEQDTGAWTWTDIGASSELASEDDPSNEPGHGYYSLYYQTPELARDVRIAGRALLDTWIRPQVGPGAHLTPVLLDVEPNGTMHVAERGFMNMDYRNGLEASDPLGAAEWGHTVVDLLPQDYTFRAGHRVGLLVMSSNRIWAVPGTPQLTVNIANGPIAGMDEITGSSLVLPVVGAPEDPSELFVGEAPTAPPTARFAAPSINRQRRGGLQLSTILWLLRQ